MVDIVQKVCDDSFVIRSIYHDQILNKGGHCGGYVKKVCDDSYVIRSIYHDQYTKQRSSLWWICKEGM